MVTFFVKKRYFTSSVGLVRGAEQRRRKAGKCCRISSPEAAHFLNDVGGYKTDLHFLRDEGYRRQGG